MLEQEGVSHDQTFPANSPDLNLIECVWAEMTKALAKRAIWSRDDLVRAVQEEWAKIAEHSVQRLYGSWKDRLQAVIDANGGATGY